MDSGLGERDGPLATMRNVFLILVLFGLANWAVGPAVLAAAPKPAPPLLGYTITNAPGWRTDTSRLKQSITQITAAPVHKFAPILIVSETKFPPAATVRDLKTLTHKHMPKLFRNYKLIAERFGSLDGAPTYEIVGTYQLGASKLKLRGYNVFALRPGVMTTITATVPDIDHLRYEPAIGQMIQSVKLTSSQPQTNKHDKQK